MLAIPDPPVEDSLKEDAWMMWELGGRLDGFSFSHEHPSMLQTLSGHSFYICFSASGRANSD